MSDVAIRVEGLGKQYRLGGSREQYSTLRDQFRKWISLRGLLRRANRAEHSPPFWALKNVSFEVKQGEVIGIIGRNGAGKSTLLKILSRITEPTEGGADIHGRVGSLLEVGTGFHPELTGRENVYLNGAIMGMKRVEIVRKFDEIVAFAEVEKFIDTSVKHYSSGMYMRLAFAVAAHLEPEILIVDEVLAVGDAQFQKKCLGKMGDVASSGRTIVFVSHHMPSILALCNRAVYLHLGNVVEFGDVTPVTQRYLVGLSAPPEQTSRAYRYRPGTGEFRFTDVSLAKPFFDPGEEIVLNFATERRVGRGGQFGISFELIDDESQRVVVHVDSRLVDYWVGGNDPCRGRLIIRSPWLKPGRYQIDAYIFTSTIIDKFEAAAYLEVMPRMPYPAATNDLAGLHGTVLADFEIVSGD